MAQHMKQSECELNELLTEYWKLRHEAGMCISLHHTTLLIKHVHRLVYGNHVEQVDRRPRRVNRERF